MTIDRRAFLALGAGATLIGPGLGGGLAPAPVPGTRPRRQDWQSHDALDLGLRGQAWADVAAPYDRLPAKAQETVRPEVWNLSRQSTGLHVEFLSDATALRIDVELTSANLDRPHIPASGASGIDLYTELPDGSLRWTMASKPAAQTYHVDIEGLAAGARKLRLYLPLYNGVSSLKVSCPGDAKLEGVPRQAGASKPIVYYGTSIAHGASASRPGMSFVNILGRRLGVEMINLGFSGNGRLEMEVADLLVELDPAAFVLDCLPNLSAGRIAARTAPFVRRLREARPDTPIVLVEDRTNANSLFLPSRAAHHAANHAAFRAAYQTLIGEGVKGLTYVPDAPFLGADGEGTVDGSHPTDLGMMRYADALEPILRGVI